MPAFALSSEAIASNHELRAFDCVGSTNQLAMQASRQGETGNCWFVSAEQTAGKGRLARKWQTGRGNMAASILLHLPKTTGAPHLLGFVAALSIAQTIEKFSIPTKAEPALKWPNDVLMNQAKIAGILLESAHIHPEKISIVVGMGINIVGAPQNVPYPTAFLNQYERTCTAPDVFRPLTKNWVKYFDLWDHDKGRKPIIENWLARATGIGQAITVNRAKDSIQGVFQSIDNEGRLIVKLANGKKQIVTAGDVQY